ncbi:MAG: triose-phosphate isomerase [Ignavibacteriales bacterium]
MNRKIIVAGNWKMNMLPSQAGEFVKKLGEAIGETDVDVVVCPPFVCLNAVIQAVKDLTINCQLSTANCIKVGAQNIHWEEKGAFTGEVSPAMLVDMGVEYVIIGHSERRQYFAETNETVNKKVHSAFKYGLKPIVCVGETLEQREQGITNDLLRLQARIGLMNLTAEQVKNTIIAYEPIWAIGTGKTASPEDANNAIAAIRKLVAEVYGQETADAIRIQYGGSVNASNAKELFEMPDIDGGLVGGASLKVEDFEKIVKR